MDLSHGIWGLMGWGGTRGGDYNGRTWDYLEYPGGDILKAKFREDCPPQYPRLTFTGSLGFFLVNSCWVAGRGWRAHGPSSKA